MLIMVFSDLLLKIGNLFYRKVQLGNMISFLGKKNNPYMYPWYITWKVHNTDPTYYLLP